MNFFLNPNKFVDDVGIRHRLSSASPTQDEDLDALIKYNRNMQEIIAENMLLMTSNMKEHALTANAIIKKDMSSLEKSDKLTEINAVKLNKESLKLEEHTKSKWRCLVWVMIAFVLAVFFSKSSITQQLLEGYSQTVLSTFKNMKSLSTVVTVLEFY